MPKKLSDRFLIVGGHPFRACMSHPNDHHRQDGYYEEETSQKSDGVSPEGHEGSGHPSSPDEASAAEAEGCCCSCCRTDSPLYARCWPLIFFFSALTDFPLPLPKGKKPGQHRDWGWMPVLVVMGIVAFVYYAYLDHVCLTLIRRNRLAQGIVYLVPLHLGLVLFFCTYARVVLSRPGNPTHASSASDTTPLLSSLTYQQFTDRLHPPVSILGGAKWCNSCQGWKPDRAHHCRVCDACVLKMDHHCPWVNGCVGFGNQRYYIQFLCYTSFLGTWIFITSLVAFVSGNGLHAYNGVVVAVLVVSGILMVVIGSFTLSHLWMILLNRTTIENNQFQQWSKNKDSGKRLSIFTSQGRNVFDQGPRSNWKEVMGNHWWQWFVPIAIRRSTPYDGIQFGYNDETLRELERERQPSA